MSSRRYLGGGKPLLFTVGGYFSKLSVRNTKWCLSGEMRLVACLHWPCKFVPMTPALTNINCSG